MTKEKADWIKYSNIVPIAIMLLTGFVQLVFFLTATQNSINLINQKLDSLTSSLVDGSTYAQQNRTDIQQLRENVADIKATLRAKGIAD